MNILVIGNGFDIEHGLPTKYADFLDFMKGISEIATRKYIGKKEYFESELENIIGHTPDKKVKEFLLDDIFYEHKNFEEWSKKKNSTELCYCSNRNIWVEYFLKKENYINERWVDFETEISNVIKSLEYAYELSRYIENNPRNGDSIGVRIRTYEKYDINKDMVFDKIISFVSTRLFNFTKRAVYNISGDDIKIIAELLNKDLIEITRCLEIYLCDYVEKVSCSKSKYIKNEEYDGVLSFNYTNTFEKIYSIKKYSDGKQLLQMPYDYIHGKADVVEHKTKKENNMVLGIDEYLSEEEKNVKLDLIQFKKYFQRIFKKTGSEYVKWIQHMNRYGEDNNIVIFGHSLDVSDKDILKKLILESGYKNKDGTYGKNTNVIIYYYNEDVYAQQISNLVKIIGQDELIDRVSGQNPRIVFNKQD